MGPRAGLDAYGNSRPHRDSIPGLGATVQIIVARNCTPLLLKRIEMNTAAFGAEFVGTAIRYCGDSPTENKADMRINREE